MKTFKLVALFLLLTFKMYAQKQFELDPKLVNEYTTYIKANNIEQKGNEVLTAFKQIATNLEKSYHLLQQKDTTEAFIIYKQQTYPKTELVRKELSNEKYNTEFFPIYKKFLALTREKATTILTPHFSKFGETGIFYFKELAEKAMQNKEYQKALNYINLQLRVTENHPIFFVKPYTTKAIILAYLNKEYEALNVLDEAEKKLELAPKLIFFKKINTKIVNTKLTILQKLTKNVRSFALNESDKLNDDDITAIKENSLPKTKAIEQATTVLKQIEAVKVSDNEQQKYKEDVLKEAKEAKAIALAIKAKAIAFGAEKLETKFLKKLNEINELEKEILLLVDKNANKDNSIALTFLDTVEKSISITTLDRLNEWLAKWKKDLYNPQGKKELIEAINTYDNIYGKGAFLKKPNFDKETIDITNGILKR